MARAFTLGVTGPSASGKTTLAAALAEALGPGAQLISGDDFFLFDQFLTDDCCIKACKSGTTWKDWENPAAVDLEKMAAAVRTAAATAGVGFVVVEGFQLLASAASTALFDGVIAVGVPRDECWARRKARALAMAHLPPGFSNSESDEKNYEVVGSYVLSTADTAAVTAAAAEHAPEDGRLAWLRLYFDEVIWPAAVAQAEHTRQYEASMSPRTGPVPGDGGKSFMRLDGCDPVGKDPWLDASVGKALAFATASVAASAERRRSGGGSGPLLTP